MNDKLKERLEFIERFRKERDVPLGSNDLSALAIFQQRKYYDEDIYPSKYYAPTPMNLWNENPFFGKVNFEGNTVFAPKTFLKQVDNNVWALDFVADAFNDFKEEFLFLNKKAVKGTPFATLSPSRGWSSAIDFYDSFMDYVYETFVDYIIETKMDEQLTTFDKFMDIFYEFVDTNSPRIPVTFSQFILSPNCPVAISGLMIDISTDLHGNDQDKYNHFINDRNFICFAEAAERFGFKIDKNFPGRLIADINSPVMTREGDPNIPPSLGGRGYMLRYPERPKEFTKLRPSEPQQEILPPPSPQYSNPFEVGDRVAIAVVLSEYGQALNSANPPVMTTNYLFEMLRDHTELKNRNKEPGSRPKRDPEGRDEFAMFKDHTFRYTRGISANPKLINIYGKIEAFNPNPRQVARWWGVAGDLATGGGPSPAGGWAPAEGMVVVNMREWDGALRGIWWRNLLKSRKWRGSRNARGELRPAMDQFQFDTYDYRKRWNTPNPQPSSFEDFDMQIEVPFDAIHLKNDNSPFVLNRFAERISYPIRLQKWQTEQTALDLKWREKFRDWQDRALPEWTRLNNEYLERLNFFNTATRLNANNLFERRFGSAYLADVNMLKEICMQFYHSYVSQNPQAIISKLTKCSTGTYITKRKKIVREEITQTSINRKYTEIYWLKQYILLQNAQLKKKLPFKKLRVIRRRAIQFYNKVDMTEAVKYINEQLTADQSVVPVFSLTFKKRS